VAIINYFTNEYLTITDTYIKDLNQPTITDTYIKDLNRLTFNSNVLDLVLETDIILKTKIPELHIRSDLNLEQIVANMHETMNHHRAVGLSANQVGLSYRLFVMKDRVVCINPKILDMSTQTEYDIEGCLSFPNLYVKIKRPKKIAVEYQNLDGHIVNERLSLEMSRIYQHELDHLDGITILNRANRYHRDMAIKKRRK